MKQLDGKVAFVTGAANGIGLALTRALLAQGMKVMMADVQREALDRAVAVLGLPAARVQAVTVDVRDPASMAAAAEATRAAFGRVHLLCNNAGVGGLSPMLAAGLDEWRWVLDVNLFGAIHGVQAFLPLLQAHGEGGHIVNTGSMASFLTPPPMVPGGGLYATSKAALRGYTDALRIALAGSGIGVTGVYPAMVATALDRTTLANRPGALGDGGMPPSDAPSMLQQIGIPAEVVAERVVQAVLHDAPAVFTHAEVKPLLAAQFDALLAAFPQPV
jgi:NAD(P)-dependent dehydrogenase (short-subunit alcohol dehydrogenase family)